VPAIIILPNNVTAIGWYQILGCFTMFPLLIRDGLRAPYFIINVLFIIALIIVKREIQDFVHAPISLRFKFPSLFSSTYFEFLMKIFIMMSSLGEITVFSYFSFIAFCLLFFDLFNMNLYRNGITSFARDDRTTTEKIS
jgi:hypothetical protein